MALAPSVLILTNKLDVSADLVVLRLQARGIPYLRINVEDCSECLVGVTFPDSKWTWKDRWHGPVDLSQVSAVWFRRPGMPMENNEHLSAPTRSFLVDQWKMFVLGLRSIAHVSWINDPFANAAAEVKIVQLATAVRVGLRVPATCVTNDLGLARAQRFPLVAKSLGSAFVEEPDADYFIYTTETDLSDAAPEEVQLAPIIFQQRLWPKADYRVTIVGSRVFAAKIRADAARPLDWRATKKPPEFEHASLPIEVQTRLLALLEALRLRFGAVDLCQADGDFFFLEVNPNGEWGWLETSLGLPIADAIVDELCQTS